MERWSFCLYTPEQVMNWKNNYSRSFLRILSDILTCIVDKFSVYTPDVGAKEELSVDDFCELFRLFPGMKMIDGVFDFIPEPSFRRNRGKVLKNYGRYFKI